MPVALQHITGTALGVAVLLSIQGLGGVLVDALGLPIPGSVVGMLLLLGSLLAWGREPAFLGRAADLLLGHMALFFIPAGAGVVALGPVLAAHGWAAALMLFGGTWLILVLGALLFRRVS